MQFVHGQPQNKQSGHKVVNLSTGLTLMHSQIAHTPLTQFVENTVKAVTIEQGPHAQNSPTKRALNLAILTGMQEWIALPHMKTRTMKKVTAMTTTQTMNVHQNLSNVRAKMIH